MGSSTTKEKGQHLKEVPIMDRAGEAFEQGKEVFNKAIENVSPAVKDAYGVAEEGVKHAIETTTQTIKKYPVQTLLAGFGIGCLVGMLLRRTE
jgi:ElaB/YqjD/DUF883 family membrane-anchored ribosome-binding protein